MTDLKMTAKRVAELEGAKERPILFSAPMVRAILAGTKTQTRRVVKPAYVNDNGYSLREVVHGEAARKLTGPNDRAYVGFGHPSSSSLAYFGCPYGQPGDRLWVRETLEVSFQGSAYYAADMAPIADHDALGPLCDRYGHPYFFNELKGVPSIHMPRWASRITLEIVSVRVERLNEISEADASAEGAPLTSCGYDADADLSFASYRKGFSDLWESINGAGGWAANPWVWVIEFRRMP